MGVLAWNVPFAESLANRQISYGRAGRKYQQLEDLAKAIPFGYDVQEQ